MATSTSSPSRTHFNIPRDIPDLTLKDDFGRMAKDMLPYTTNKTRAIA